MSMTSSGRLSRQSRSRESRTTGAGELKIADILPPCTLKKIRKNFGVATPVAERLRALFLNHSIISPL